MLIFFIAHWILIKICLTYYFILTPWACHPSHYISHSNSKLGNESWCPPVQVLFKVTLIVLSRPCNCTNFTNNHVVECIKVASIYQLNKNEIYCLITLQFTLLALQKCQKSKLSFEIGQISGLMHDVIVLHELHARLTMINFWCYYDQSNSLLLSFHSKF